MSKNEDLYIAQEIRCIHCNTLADFEFTTEGMMAVTGAMLRLTLPMSKKKIAKTTEQNPLEFATTYALGKKMSINKAVDMYRLKIQKILMMLRIISVLATFITKLIRPRGPESAF